MGIDTAIEWANHTVNFWSGCTKVSPGCQFCYAEALSDRFGSFGKWGPRGTRVAVKSAEANLRKIARIYEQTGKPQVVFVNSLTDTFESLVTCHDSLSYQVVLEARERLWKAISKNPRIVFLLLTKRAENVAYMIPAQWHKKFPPNVWLGFSAENNDFFRERIKIAEETWPSDAPIFVSAEPLLGPIEMNRDHAKIVDWVIVGGESGPNARPMQPEWAESIREFCEKENIAFFFKQMGGRGKDKGGNLLNGVRYQNLPNWKLSQNGAG